MVGEVEVKERPRPSPDYLMQLLNEKKLMTSLPNLCGIFTHLERLLDEGKWRSGATGEPPWRGRKRDHGAVRLSARLRWASLLRNILASDIQILMTVASLSNTYNVQYHTSKTRNPAELV